MTQRPLEGIRVCDLSGQLAGAGGTRTLAAFGAEVIRVEDPVRQGRWDILRGAPPFVDERRGLELSGAFNNHNVGKLGVTIDTRTEAGRQQLAALVATSDLVVENFSAEVMESWGFGYDHLRELRPDVIYVSNCGFGHSGPHRNFRTWGPIVQALCGLTWSVGRADEPSAGFGFSYMDHHGANFMVVAVLAALHHRERTGEGQWIDMSTIEAGATLLGASLLEFTVNGQAPRGRPDSNRCDHMSPHGIYPAAGDDEWVAIACRSDEEWTRLAGVIGRAWILEHEWRSLADRLGHQDELDRLISAWSAGHDKFEIQHRLLDAGVPCAAVQRPGERIEGDATSTRWGLWPEVVHDQIGSLRVDGIPVHLRRGDWVIERGAPLLGQHNAQILDELPATTPAVSSAAPPSPASSGGTPLEGMRVVELASEPAAFAGKLLADLGAEVILVEPPGGHPLRHRGPLAHDLAATPTEASLAFWYDNTSKRSVVLDLDDPADCERLRTLIGGADLVLEAEPPGQLAQWGFDPEQLSDGGLVWVSVSSFGRNDPRSSDPYTDLTLMAGGGIAWSCGYDDHSLPPQSSLGTQAYRTGSIWAAIGALTALRHRQRTGQGNLVDVSLNAAVNVTTEQATQWWLTAGQTVMRQRGRHALHVMTGEILFVDRDGHEVHTGFPPTRPEPLAALVAWLDELGLRDEFPLVALIETAIELGGIDLARLAEDELLQECYAAVRGALVTIAAHLSGEDFFVGGQERGLAVGVVRSPDEVITDAHLVARGFPVEVEPALLGRPVVFPGPPVRLTGTPARITRPPRLGEHQHLVESEQANSFGGEGGHPHHR